MGNNAIGASLEIPQSVLNKLDEVDKKINLISSDSEKMATSFIGAMTRMENSINPFLAKINAIDFSQIINGINKLQAPMSNSALSAEQLANAVVRVTQALANPPKAELFDPSRVTLAENSIESINEKIRTYKRLLQENRQFVVDDVQQANAQNYANEINRLTVEYGKLNAQKKISESYDRAMNLSENTDTQRANKLAQLTQLYEKMSLEGGKYVEQLTRIREAQDRINNIQLGQASLKTFDGAMGYANSATSIEQRTQAIKYLTDARKKLSTTDSDYANKLAQLNAKILEMNRANAQAVAGSRELQREHRNLMDISGQLARKLALVFSVSQMTGYLDQIIKVRGEFELQQRSLQAILQNKDKADKLFGQVTELAVKSPFQVKELVTYTKQLAAYRIESEKLYDTTKMLADVSAGLGVDMQRLILAYGQVKAANYLRGQELRQFSEAGINILGELANYFGELKGEAISTADVFDMVSKRMVKFEDVADVFKRLTSEGGIFYNMQEIQSETLKGQLSNLRDSLDIMFNEIGKANDGIMKQAVVVVKKIVENWNLLVPILKVLATAFIANRIIVLTTSKSLIQYAIANNIATNSDAKSLTVKKLLTVAFTKLATSIKGAAMAMKAFAISNPMTLGLMASAYIFTKALGYIQQYDEAIDEITKKYEDLRKNIKDIHIQFDFALRDNDLKKQKKELMDLVNIANNDYQMDINIAINDLNAEEIKNKFNELKNELFEINRFSEYFAKEMERVAHWTILEDDIFEDFKDLKNSYKDFEEYIYKTKTNVTHGLIELGNAMSDTQKEALKLLETPRQSDQTKEGYETELVYLERLKKAYSMLFDEAFKGYRLAEKQGKSSDILAGEMKKTLSYLSHFNLDTSFFKFSRNLQKNLEEAEKEFKKFASGIYIPVGLSQEERTLRVKVAIDKLATAKGLDDFEKETMYRLANMHFNVNIGYSLIEKDDKLDFLAKQINKYLQDKVGTVKMESLNISFVNNQTGKEYIEENVASIKELKKELEQTEKATERLNKNKTNIQRINELREEIRIRETLNRAFGIYNDGSSKSNDIDKQRLSLLKDLKSQYENLLKYYTKEEASQRVYSNNKAEILRLGLQINEMTRYELSEYLKLLNTLKQTPDVLKEIANTKTLIDIKIKEESIKKAKNDIEKLFSDYDYAINIESSGVDTTLLSNMFSNLDIEIGELDLEPKSIVDIFRDAENEIKKLRDENSLESIKIADEEEKKLNDRKRKYAEDTAKKYLEYTKKSVAERLNIELEAQKEIDKVRSEQKITGLSDSQMQGVISNIETQKKGKLDALAWNYFKEGGLYTKMFEDLEYVSSSSLEMIRSKLSLMRNELSNLNPSDLKEIINAMEKVDEQIVSRNPFKSLGRNLRNVISTYKDLNKAQETFVNSSYDVEIQDEVVKNKEREYIIQKQIVDSLNSNKDATDEEKKSANEKLNTIKNELSVEQQILDDKKNENKEDSNNLTIQENKLKTLNKQLNGIGAKGSQLVSSISEVTQMLSNWGVDFGEQFDSIMSGFGQTFGALESIDITRPFTLITGMAGVFSGIGNTIGGIFGFGNKDKKREREIQKQIEKVEELEKSYEKLGKAIEDAYSFDQLQASNEQAQNNIKAQISAYEQMIASEKSKKKKDNSRIKEWQDNIESLKEKSKELYETELETLGGIGDKVNEAAQNFIDAWFDAFNETGDGLSGLEDKWDEYINNIIKKQMMLKYASNYLKPLFNAIDKMFAEDSEGGIEVTKNELNKTQNLADKTLPELNDALKDFAERIGFTPTNNGSLSGLQKGIQSVTEETAQALEAMLNSMRFFVADDNKILKDLYNAFTSFDENYNPILGELRLQTIQMTAINKLLNGVTGNSASTGSKGIRVYIQ